MREVNKDELAGVRNLLSVVLPKSPKESAAT